MKIVTSCPICKNEAMSKIRRIFYPGMLITCRSCKAELGVKKRLSTINLALGLLAIIIVNIIKNQFLVWPILIALIVSSSLFQAREELIIINVGPNKNVDHS
ncbi:hypothetical protein ACE017_11505 [Shewanella mangrovisoli]|uniref:hypothetical protein n=1 Tax=Shewanella mangrovisoli TaxID=2864211 RepID=UPI0035B77BF5